MRRKKEKKNAARENGGYTPIPMEDPESGAMRDDDETLMHAAYAKQNLSPRHTSAPQHSVTEPGHFETHNYSHKLGSE